MVTLYSWLINIRCMSWCMTSNWIGTSIWWHMIYVCRHKFSCECLYKCINFFAQRWNCTYLNYVWNAVLRYLCFGYIHISRLGANKLDIIVIFWRNFTTMKSRSRALEHLTSKYKHSAKMIGRLGWWSDAAEAYVRLYIHLSWYAML